MSIAILLVGHGSARHPNSATPMHALARQLADLGSWADVKAGFMKQSPLAAEVLSTMSADIIVVIPVFAGKGYYTDRLVPQHLGLTGSLTLRNRQQIFYTPPVGCHPMLPGIMACRADGIARSNGWNPRQTSLLLIAHGSQRPGGAGETPRAIAASIAQTNHFLETDVLFLEQEPWAKHWANHLHGNRIVALPLLIAQGTHASQDIPALFGPEHQTAWHIGDRHITLATGLGTEPDLLHLICDMVRQATGKIP